MLQWTTDDCWKYSLWFVVVGETGFAHAGAVINDDRENFIVSHSYRSICERKTGILCNKQPPNCRYLIVTYP